MNGWKTILRTQDSWPELVLRLILGVVFFAHGSQKWLGWFGGYGFSGTLGFLTQQMHMPMLLALYIIFTEFFGGLALMLGLAGRLAALAVTVLMLGAIAMVHWPTFFMNWAGNQKGEGLEYHLLVLAICVALIIRGSGKWSADRAIAG